MPGKEAENPLKSSALSKNSFLKQDSLGKDHSLNSEVFIIKSIQLSYSRYTIENHSLSSSD